MYFRADTNQLIIEGKTDPETGNRSNVILGYLGKDENNDDIYGLSIGSLSTVPELTTLSETVQTNSEALSNYSKKITITDEGIKLSSEEGGIGNTAELTSEALILRAGSSDHITESVIDANGFTINNGIINEQLRFNNE